MSRSGTRAETRSRAKDDIKRVMHVIDKVRHWEKKWITYENSTNGLQVYKWVPVHSASQKKRNFKKSPTETVPESESIPPSVLNGEDSNRSFTVGNENECPDESMDFTSVDPDGPNNANDDSLLQDDNDTN